MEFLGRVAWYRFFLLIVVPNLALLLIAHFTDALRLIPALGMVLIAMASAVCVAFIPNVVRAFDKSRPLDGEMMICLGIFSAWSDWVFRQAMSLVWRFFPDFKWIVDSDLNSWILFIAIYAAACHLAAPAVINGKVPSTRWVRIGVTAGVGIFLGLVLIYWPELSRLWDIPSLYHPRPVGFQTMLLTV